MSGSNITPVITPTALTNHFCTILNITINMKDVSMNNLINTEVLAYNKRCHMEVKICILHSLGQMGNFPGSGIRNKQVSDIESGYPDIESGYPDIRI